MNEKRLIRRYLVWCYKTTKEDLERTDRKFTQLQVDYFILEYLEALSGDLKDSLARHLGEFRDYIAKKEESAASGKFQDPGKNILRAEYLYLRKRFEAVEKAVIHFLGKKELLTIQRLYEAEMTRRI